MKKNFSLLPLFVTSTALTYPLAYAQDPLIGTLQPMVISASNAAPKKVTTPDASIMQIGDSLPTTELKPVEGQSVMTTLGQTPGLSIYGGPRQIGQQISLRGLSGNRINVGIDGIDNTFASFGHNQQRLLPNSFMFKKVAVSSPGSNILEGSGSIGGSVNFTTIDPSDLIASGENFGGKVMTGLSSNAPGGQTGVAVAARSGDVQYLASITGMRASDAKFSDGVPLDHSAHRQLQGLAKLIWDLSADQKLKLSYLSMQDVGDYPESTDSSVSAYTPLSAFNMHQQQLQLEYFYNPKNPLVNFHAKLYRLQTDQGVNPLSGTDRQDITIKTTGINLNNQSTVFESHHLLYGIDLKKTNGENGAPNSGINSFPQAKQQSYAGFLKDTWSVLPKLDLIYGLRYDNYKSNSQGLENNGHHLSKQLTTLYHLTSEIDLYGGYTESFRAPNLSELYLSGVHSPVPGFNIRFIANRQLKPEVGRNKEIGIIFNKTLDNEAKIKAKVDGYINNVSNYITYSATGTYPNLYEQNINITSARLYGYEASVSYQTQHWQLGSGLSMTRGTTQSAYTNDEGKYIPAGSALPVPALKGYVSGGLLMAQWHSKISARLDFAKAQDRTPVGVDSVGGYGVTSVSYQWNPKNSLKGLNIVAGISNLFDKKYEVYDGESHLESLGRSIYVQAVYHF